MSVKTFRAYSMAEALSAVKTDLGADAAILHTRSFKRGGILGVGGRTVVEVTAARASDAPHRGTASRSRRGAQAGGIEAGGAGRDASAGGVSNGVTSGRAAARRAYAGSGTHASANGQEGSSSKSVSSARPSSMDARTMDLIAAIEQHRRAHPPQATQSQRAGDAVPAHTPPRDGHAVHGPQSAPATQAHSRTTGNRPTTDTHGARQRQHVQPTHPIDGEAKSAARVTESVARRYVLRDSSTPKATPASVPSNRGQVLRIGEDTGENGRAPATSTLSTASGSKSAPSAASEPSGVHESSSDSQSLPSGKPLVEIESKLLSAVEKSNRESAAVQSEMHTLREMVGRILAQQESSAVRFSKSFGPRFPKQLHLLFDRLLDQEMPEGLARTIIEKAQQHLDVDAVEDANAVRAAVRAQLMRLIPVSPTRFTDLGRGAPCTIALIGPTGVGKTTTIAKLAATCKLTHGLRVGLVTSDTYRIAAVDQLRTYAEIIGVPLKVALTPEEMTRSCSHLRDCDVVLIDSAGRSQRDEEKIGELQQFIDAASPDEVHLVLSGTASGRVLSQAIDSFARVRAEKLILTKVDEAVSFGALISIVRRVGKPLSFLTTGQEVPSEFEEATSTRLVDMLLDDQSSGSTISEAQPTHASDQGSRSVVATDERSSPVQSIEAQDENENRRMRSDASRMLSEVED